MYDNFHNHVTPSHAEITLMLGHWTVLTYILMTWEIKPVFCWLQISNSFQWDSPSVNLQSDHFGYGDRKAICMHSYLVRMSSNKRLWLSVEGRHHKRSEK